MLLIDKITATELKKFREKNGHSLESVAKATGWSVAKVEKFEAAELPMTVSAICDYCWCINVMFYTFFEHIGGLLDELTD